MAKEFLATRRNITFTAVLGVAITFPALLLLEANKERLSDWFYSASINVAGLLFGLAVVSLVWEYLVRRGHSEDLRYYLRLGSSVAKSGLQDVLPRSRLDWQQLLSSANDVTVLSYNAEWLERNMHTLSETARTRPLSVVVAVPIKGGAYLTREALAQQTTADALAATIAETASRSARLWRDAKQSGQRFHKNSSFVVLEHDFELGYEVIMIDRTTIVTLAAATNSPEILDRVAFVYEQSAEEYPTSFFASHKSKFKNLTALENVE